MQALKAEVMIEGMGSRVEGLGFGCQVRGDGCEGMGVMV